MDFGVLGALIVVREGQARTPSGAKERAILAHLLLTPGAPVSADALLEALWPDTPRAAASRSLSVRIARLRAFLEPDRDPRAPPAVLLRDVAGYRLDVEPQQVDAGRFEAAIRSAATLPPAAALAALDAAAALWRGAPFPELADSGVARAEVRRLEEGRRQVDELRADALLALDRPDEAAAVLEPLVEAEPLREEVVRAQMLARYRAGRQVEALAAYRGLAERLLEVGLRPVGETRDLERRILEQDPALALAAVPEQAAGAVAAARPLVGRDRELAVLDAALRAAVDGRRGVVLLAGEAGVGKSALVDAFRAAAGAASAHPLFALGQCVEHRGPGEPYLPVLDALAALARDGADAEVIAALAQRAPTWLVQLPWLVADDQLETIERRVRGATRSRMLRELQEAVEALAQRRPLVLVLEDLHWADEATLDLLAALARRRAPARVLVVATFRPGVGGDGSRGPSAVEGVAVDLTLRGDAEHLTLGRLADADLAGLVLARFPSGAPPEVTDVLARRTAGNPLFASLLLDHWTATGALTQDGGTARLAVERAALEDGVPLTLRAHLQQELAALDPADAELLQAAAVAGRRFVPATLAAALEQPEAAVAARCAALGRATALVEPRNGGLAFAHDLEREVFRDGLDPERRAALHARVGAQLEREYGVTAAEHAAELAHHFLAGRDPAHAVRFLRAAAEVAFARSAHREGIRHLGAALDACAALPAGMGRSRLEVELLAQIGQATVATEGWSSPGAEEALERARAVATELDDNEPLVSVLLALATLREVRGEVAVAHELTAECLRRAPVGDQGVRLEAEELLACSLFHQGTFARALEHAEAGVALFQEASAQAPAGGGEAGHYSTFPATLGDNAGVSCQDWAGLALWFLGFPDQALERAQLALGLSGDPGRAYSRATASAQLAVVHACRREPAEVLRWASRTISGAGELGYAYREAMGLVLHGWAVAQLGEPQRGAAIIADGLRASRATGARMDDQHYLALLAEAWLLAGDRAAAEAAIDEGVAVGRQQRSRHLEPELLRLRAAASEPGGVEALAALREAITVAHEQGSRMLELRARTDLVRALSTAQPAAAASARGALAALLAELTEGFDTVDVRAAREVVEAGR